jgi:prepilin-type N-terminal cleavage/methylation domain-containing protein
MRAAAGIADEEGFSLIELAVVLAILTFVVGSFYALLVTTDRGWALLQGQLDAQQNPRIATDRLVNDVQQSSDYTIPGGSQLSVQKVTIVTCPAAAGATQILVENSADMQTGTTVTLTALSAQAVGEVITPTGSSATCGANSTSGAVVLITPTLPGSLAFGLPYGTLVSPITVTYSLSGSQILRATPTAILADYTGALSFTQQTTTLNAASAAGSASVTVTNSVPSTSDFAVGDLIFVGSEIRAIAALTVGAATTTLTLDQGLFSAHTAGTSVRRKLVTTQITGRVAQTRLGGQQVQQVVLPSRGAPRNPPLK